MSDIAEVSDCIPAPKRGAQHTGKACSTYHKKATQFTKSTRSLTGTKR